MKSLCKQHQSALEAHNRLNTELATVQARLAELEGMETALLPIQPATGNVEALVNYRLQEQQRAVRLEVIAGIKADLAYQAGELKAQLADARNAVNRLAGHAWTAYAESVVTENLPLLTLVAQACERGRFDLRRWLSERPDMTPAEAEQIENREGFPQWI